MKTFIAAALLAVSTAFAAPAALAEGPAADAPVILAGDHGQHHGHWQRRHHDGFSFSFQFGNGGHHGWHGRPGWHGGHGVIVKPRPVYRPAPVIHVTRAHIHWCYNRYRTYDHRSNTFVRSGGHRAYCVSPYSY
jgi:hypothetical protein